MNDFEQLVREHHALVRHYAQVQTRCSEQLEAQARELVRLRAETMRLRARALVRESALAWAREDRAALAAAATDLPDRWVLAQHVAALHARVVALLRERSRWQSSDEAADLVICQTGCLSHGDYWREHDHCRRTGKACVLVATPAQQDGPGLATPPADDAAEISGSRGRRAAVNPADA